VVAATHKMADNNNVRIKTPFIRRILHIRVRVNKDLL